MLTRRPSCASLVAIRPFVCEKKRFAQKFTDGRTDRRRTPRHCISSFLEWAKNESGTVFYGSQCICALVRGACLCICADLPWGQRFICKSMHTYEIDMWYCATLRYTNKLIIIYLSHCYSIAISMGQIIDHWRLSICPLSYGRISDSILMIMKLCIIVWSAKSKIECVTGSKCDHSFPHFSQVFIPAMHFQWRKS